MYGFPTQTAQETIDSLEIVRQLFQNNILQSGFWHQFAMTAHSPVGLMPEQFKVKKVIEAIGTFANNDIEHIDPTGARHEPVSYTHLDVYKRQTQLSKNKTITTKT